MMVRAALGRGRAPDAALSGQMAALELAFRAADARSAEASRRGPLPAHPTVVEHGPVRLLICAAPGPGGLGAFMRVLRAERVRHVVRACERGYDAAALAERGFVVHEMPFEDGGAPPPRVVARWLALLDDVAALGECAWGTEPGGGPGGSADAVCVPARRETVAIQCVAGLGRAPVLAATALVELGMDPYEAVGWIRSLRRGAINRAQMHFLENYERRPPPVSRLPRRSRSSSLVGSFLKATRSLRPRSPPRRESPVPLNFLRANSATASANGSLSRA